MDPITISVISVVGAIAVGYCAVELACKPCLKVVRDKMGADEAKKGKDDAGGDYSVI